jgi:S1-C subfamily serine protease
MLRPLRISLAGFAAVALLAGAACSSNGAGSDSPTDNPRPAPTSSVQTNQPRNTGADLSAEDLVRLAEPSVVRVETNTGVGSGFIIDAGGYIMTNNHVVAGARSVRVTLSDGSDYDASIVGTDPRSDLALLKIDAKDLDPLDLANLDDVQIGQDVIAIGYALDLQMGEGPSFSVTRGIVSQKNRGIDEGDTAILGSIQTDAAINHGNSGGPLLNLRGEVVGVNTALQPDQATGGVAQGIGYAVGSDTVKAVFEQLRDDGRVNRGLLGVRGFSAVQPADARELGLPDGTKGIVLSPEPIRSGTGTLSSVDANGPAGRAGIQPGDVITKVADMTIDNESDLAIAMIKHGPGEKVDVELFRGGKKMTVQVTLGTPT